jgi:hypothetical protein
VADKEDRAAIITDVWQSLPKSRQALRKTDERSMKNGIYAGHRGRRGDTERRREEFAKKRSVHLNETSAYLWEAESLQKIFVP